MDDRVPRVVTSGSSSRSAAAFLCLSVLLVVAQTFTGALAESEVHLTIFPTSENQTRPIGRQFLLTCSHDASDQSLITDLKWTDPEGRDVPQNRNTIPKPHVYSTMIPGGKLAMMIPELRESDSGDYTCSAIYSNTKKLVKTVHVQTIVAITWEDAPPEQNPIIYTNYKIRCKVTANPAPIVDWLRNGDIIETKDRYVVDSTGLQIQNITEADDGVYVCRAIVVATGEMAERPIKVEVHTPPQILDSMPKSVEAIEGLPFSIQCLASGKPSPKFKWVQDSTSMDLSSAGRFTVEPNTGVLTIAPAVEALDDGDYKCEASNEAGTKDKVVRLTVVVRPKIHQLTNISVPTSQEAILECRASGKPLPEITFRKLSNHNRYVNGIQNNEDRITVDGISKVNEDGTQRIGQLIISNVIRSDDGLYECIAKNKGGEVIKNGLLTVEFGPSFANTPDKEKWSWERNPVNLTCRAESIPNATISWRFGGQDIFRSQNETMKNYYQRFGNGPESTLMVTPVTNAMYGPYRCTAVNKHGSVTHDIQLREAKAPSNINQVTVDTITATTITFNFISPRMDGGLPTKTYIVNYKEERETWNEALTKSWVIDSPYVLENLKPQTTYSFRFAAQNDVGKGPWSSPQVHTTAKRSAPEEPQIINKSPDGVAMSSYVDRFEVLWKIPADNGEPIDEYSVKYCPANKRDNRWKVSNDLCQTKALQGQLTSYVLQDLRPDTYYKVEVRAHNIIGYSIPGEIIAKTAPVQSMSEPEVKSPDNSTLSSAVIIAIVIALLILMLIVIDLLCCFINKGGIIMTICEKTRGKPDDVDAKLGRDEKEPLKDTKDAMPLIQDRVKRETSVDFDVKKSISRTNFVGKDSAV